MNRLYPIKKAYEDDSVGTDTWISPQIIRIELGQVDKKVKDRSMSVKEISEVTYYLQAFSTMTRDL